MLQSQPQVRGLPAAPAPNWAHPAQPGVCAEARGRFVSLEGERQGKVAVRPLLLQEHPVALGIQPFVSQGLAGGFSLSPGLDSS